ncbi:hypothetical protein AX17_002062 [Amanita inopinata Kibby_2008]|nr:hypothetical protein AX17_002062 [Amanita inopinata Kibby_2008]
MTTFAKASFNASIYSAARPTYPGKLFKRIFGHHKRSPEHQYELALDLGCGTGQATRHLMPFKKIIGVDLSEPMLSSARTHFVTGPWVPEAGKVTFAKGSAEDLSKIVPDGAADLIISAQSAHWFDWNKVWSETRRVLRKGGSAAFWVYSEFRLSRYPELSPIITQYAQGRDPMTSLGPHFQRPGRTILENHLLDVPEPCVVLGGDDCGLGHVERVFFTGSHHPYLPPATPRRVTLAPNEPRIEHNPVIMEKPKLRWLNLLAYFRSWSSLHNYLDEYPQDAHRPPDERFLEEDAAFLRENPELVLDAEELGVGQGDIAVRFWKDLRAGVKEAGGEAGLMDVISVEWPVAMILARRI